VEKVNPKALYVYQPLGRKGRVMLDDASERFVDETRIGVALS
jgi:hypothetical protein